jgi:hypothetical protein
LSGAQLPVGFGAVPLVQVVKPGDILLSGPHGGGVWVPTGGGNTGLSGIGLHTTPPRLTMSTSPGLQRGLPEPTGLGNWSRPPRPDGSGPSGVAASVVGAPAPAPAPAPDGGAFAPDPAPAPDGGAFAPAPDVGALAAVFAAGFAGALAAAGPGLQLGGVPVCPAGQP